MARHRRFDTDNTYGDWHRALMSPLYERIGHRVDMADRDWMEFCHFCKEPLLLVEEVRNLGQDLSDKGVSVTTKLARRSDVPAVLLAVTHDYPFDGQLHIGPHDDPMDLHSAEAFIQRLKRKIETEYPATKRVSGFVAQVLYPRKSDFFEQTPSQWTQFVVSLHNHHLHNACAAGSDLTDQELDDLRSCQQSNPLWRYIPTVEQLRIDAEINRMKAQEEW